MTRILPQLTALIEKFPEEEQWPLYWKLVQWTIDRKYTRQPYGLEAGYTIAGKEYVDRIKDMSYKGLFIETEENFPVGQEVELQLPIPNSSRTTRTTGVIVRTASDGIGIKLTVEEDSD